MLEVSRAAAPGKNLLVPLCWTARKSTEGCEAQEGTGASGSTKRPAPTSLSSVHVNQLIRSGEPPVPGPGRMHLFCS